MTRPEARRGTVLHFIREWLPLSEGFVPALIGALRPPGVVVTSGRVTNLDRFAIEPLVSIRRVRERAPHLIRRQAITAALLEVSRRHDVGLVHVHHGYRSWEVLGLVRRRRIPLVVSLHGHDVSGYISGRSDLLRPTLQQAGIVVVPSHFLVEHAIAAGARPEVIRVIPSGVDTTFFEPAPLPHGPPEVVFVGRFVEKKGLDTLVVAWPLVRRAVPGARLRLLGYGPLVELAQRAGDGVEVVLAPDRAMVREALGRAQLVVSPSRTAADDAFETLLIVNLEAQAVGRPLVTTRHAAIPEYVREGVTALLVPEADPASLAEAMIAVLSDRALAERLASAGPAVASQYDVTTCAAKVASAYEELGLSDS